MRLRIVQVAALGACLLGCLVQLAAARGPEQEQRVREALWLGMDYMIRSASEPKHFEEHASDYLFFFADVVRLQDPWIQAEARRVGSALGRIYLAKYFRLDSADEVIDAASALLALDQLDVDVQAPMVLLREAAGRFSPADYLGLDPARGEAPDLDELIDLIIGLHFTDRLDLAPVIGLSYAEILHYLPAVEYQDFAHADSSAFIDQNNLVTHLFYTWSGYASWNIDGALLPREMAYIRRHMDLALSWADPETLAEFIDSLKLAGFDESDPDIAQGVELLLAAQKPDGRWEPDQPEDEYDRYHATWCAMDALRDYVLDGPDGAPDALSRSLLESWAADLSAGRPMGGGLQLARDKIRDEEQEL